MLASFLKYLIIVDDYLLSSSPGTCTYHLIKFVGDHVINGYSEYVN